MQIGQNKGVETLRIPSLEEIDAAYEDGKAAVVALIMELAAVELPRLNGHNLTWRCNC